MKNVKQKLEAIIFTLKMQHYILFWFKIQGSKVPGYEVKNMYSHHAFTVFPTSLGTRYA